MTIWHSVLLEEPTPRLMVRCTGVNFSADITINQLHCYKCGEFPSAHMSDRCPKCGVICDDIPF